MNRLYIVLVLVLLAGCSSAPPQEEAPNVPPSKAVNSESEPESRIDMEGLERALKLSTPAEILGYREAAFDTCRVGYGFSSSRDCRRLVMAVLHVRLQCRDSEGTISNALGASDLRAIAGQDIRWTLAGRDGVAQSDGDGYVELRAVFPKSPRTQRLRLAVGLQFLHVRANEVTRLVTPRPWCRGDS